MPTYTHPQDDPFLKNLHYAMEYSGGKPAIRVSGGGGGGSSGGDVTITGALPAGTNTIGSVNIANWVDGEISATEFRVKNTITGASAGDVIALISTFDLSAEPPTSSVTTAINVSTMTALSAIPDLTDLVKLGEESYDMTYAYDANDNLITETRTLGDIVQSRTYAYDANENLESRTSWTNI
jgi:YD repeat-containing protein